MTATITVLAGDGIGPEITSAALAVLDEAARRAQFTYRLDEHPFGGAAIDSNGTPLPSTTLDACRASDAVLLAAIGGPRWDAAPVRPEAGLLQLRSELGLFANIRPTRITSALAPRSPLRAADHGNVDFVIVRELTGGLYFGEPRVLEADRAVDTLPYTRREIERILAVAFELARARRRHVTVVDKANVLATSKLWRHVAEEAAARNPDIDIDYSYVDAAAMKLVSSPQHFDVIVTENLFGDILSDEAAEITGSLGTIPSISSGDTGPSLYEPIHGSAPDIAGRGIANPLAMIGSVALMLRHSFGLTRAAGAIDAACDATVAEGIVTPDLGGGATTDQVTAAVIHHLRHATTDATATQHSSIAAH